MIRLALRPAMGLVTTALVLTSSGFLLGRILPRPSWDQIEYVKLQARGLPPALILDDFFHHLTVILSPVEQTTDASRWYSLADWSSDGQQMAALAMNARWLPVGVVTFELARRETRYLIREDQTYLAPKWSPDGRWIAYSVRLPDSLTRYALYVTPTDATSPVSYHLTDYTFPSNLWSIEVTNAAVTWSSDSRSLLLTAAPVDRKESDPPTYNTLLYEIPLNGGSLLPLNEGAGLQNVAAPVLSPDGRWIAFIARQDPNTLRLYVMKRDGSDLHALQDLPTDLPPVWSRDGMSIGYWLRENTLKQFYVVDLKTGEKHQLYEFFGPMLFPTWRP